MKNIIRTSFLLICVTLFVSCQKETIFSTPKTAFSSNPSFTTMIDLLVEYGIHKDNYNILVFDDMNTFENALLLIETTGDAILEADTSLDYDAYLSAIDSSFSFFSLHQQIENQLQALENDAELFESNDPDDHFIVCDYLRTFLTPYCEVVIDNVLYIFRDGYIVGIRDYDDDVTVPIIRGLLNSNANDSEFYYLCNDNPKIFIVSPDSLTLEVDFSARQSENDINTVYFSNMTACEDYGNLCFLWNFGDGTTSTLPNPNHQYSSTGQKTVTLTASSNGVTKSLQRTIVVQKGGTSVDFTYTHNPSGWYFFTITGCVNNGDLPSYYEINFGDGTDTTVYSVSTKINVKHKYSSFYNNQNVALTVSMHTQNGVYAYSQRFLDISIKNCRKNCSAHTGGNSEIPYFHFYDNYYIKSAIQIVNFGIFHTIHSKTVFLKKKSNSSYARTKAGSLTTGAAGKIYYYSNNTPDNSCGIETYYNQSKTKSNRKKINKTRTLPSSFSVDYHSLSAYFSAFHGELDSDLQVGASISK